jgi:antitoxin MazE
LHSILEGGQAMIKNLVKHGNSWAVVIDRPILDLLKIAPESQVELTTDGKSIRIAPVDSDDKKSKVRAARAKVNSKHSKAFKKLAE